MSEGIDKTLASFDEIGNLAADAIAIVKVGGFKLSVLPKLFDALSQINALIKDAPGALPELKDLDTVEAAQVGAAAFELVKKVIGAVAA